MQLHESSKSCSDDSANLQRDAVCIITASENIDAFQVSKVTGTATNIVRYESLAGSLIDLNQLANYVIESGPCCCNSESARPIATDDNIGAFIPNESKEVNVSTNDYSCGPNKQTSFVVIQGSEVACSVSPSYSDDGKFSVIATGLGNPSFQYEIYCNGLPSGEISTATGEIASLTINKTTPKSDLFNKSLGDRIDYSIRVTNTGTATLTDVVILDTKVQLTCPSDPITLLPSEYVDCTGFYSIVSADLPSGVVDNTASVSAKAGEVNLYSEAFASVRLHSVDAVDDIQPNSVTVTAGTSINVNVASNDNKCDHGLETTYRIVESSIYKCTVVPLVSNDGSFTVVPNPAPCIIANFGFDYEILCGGEVVDTAKYKSKTCSNSKTDTWTVNGLSAKASNGIEVIFTASGNANVTSIAQGAFNATGSWWSIALASAPSLEFTLFWDTAPEAGTTKLPDADIGSGTMTIKFPCPVKDPIIHFDRIGGSSTRSNRGITTVNSNSAALTLISGATSLTKLTGTASLEVTGNTIRRSAINYSYLSSVTVNAPTSEAGAGNNNTAAGSVRINGTVTECVFSWTGFNYEGIGGDGMEIIFSKLCDLP